MLTGDVQPVLLFHRPALWTAEIAIYLVWPSISCGNHLTVSVTSVT